MAWNSRDVLNTPNPLTPPASSSHLSVRQFILYTCRSWDVHLVDKLVVEMWNLQIPEASLSLLSVSGQDVLLQQQVHLTKHTEGEKKNQQNYWTIFSITAQVSVKKMSMNGQLLDFFKIQFAKCQQANVLIQHPRLFERGCFYTWTTLLCFKSISIFFPWHIHNALLWKIGQNGHSLAFPDPLTSLHDHALCCETASQQQKQQQSVLQVNLVQRGGETLRRLFVLMKIVPWNCEWTKEKEGVCGVKDTRLNCP